MKAWFTFARRIGLEIAVVAGAALLVVLISRGFDRVSGSSRSILNKPAELPRTTKISAKTLGLGVSSLSIILLWSPSCTYCKQSAPFHKRLLQECAREHVPFHVAVPNRSDAYDDLKRLGFADSAVFEWSDLGFRVELTPALVAIDADGNLRKSWSGTLAPDEEDDLLTFIKSQGKLSKTIQIGFDLVSVSQLKRQMPGRWQIVDLRNRRSEPHEPGARRIPLDELRYRAKFELAKDQLQVVDCFMISRNMCMAGANFLKTEGYRVSLLQGD